MPEKTSLALIVPCYNEADSIPYFEAELSRFYGLFSGEFPDSEFSVVVVNNNSSDGSDKLLLELTQRLPFVKVETCSVQGYGAALKHGFAAAEAEYVCFMDLDNTYPMSQMLDLLRLIQSRKLDIVFGARLHPRSDIEPVRRTGNLFYVALLRVLMNSPLSDVCSGMRIFRSSKKDEIVRLSRNDLAFSIEFTAHVLKRKWKVAEFPIPYRHRIGDSKLSVFKDGFIFLFVVIARVFRSPNE